MSLHSQSSFCALEIDILYAPVYAEIQLLEGTWKERPDSIEYVGMGGGDQSQIQARRLKPARWSVGSESPEEFNTTAIACDGKLVPGAPPQCARCGAMLCGRKQVMNLALGFVDTMLCLKCLGKELDREPAEIIEQLIPYIRLRECFNKSWLAYRQVEDCPDRDGCLPAVCFEKNHRQER